MGTISTTVLEGRLDVLRLVDMVARLEVPVDFPRLPWATLRRGVQVLIDDGMSMAAFRGDQFALLAELGKLTGDSAFFEAYLFRGVPQRWAEIWKSNRDIESYVLPPPGTPILALTDLGIGAQLAGESYVPPQEWLDLARQCQAAGNRLIAYVPYERDRWPRLLRNAFDIVHWHHARGRSRDSIRLAIGNDGRNNRLVAAVNKRNPHAVVLAHLASLAAWIEPALLRKLRLELLPDTDGGAEADLWLSPLVSTRSEKAIMFRPGVATTLRRALYQQNAPLFEQAWEVVKEYRQETGASHGTWIEEEINYWLAKGGPQAQAQVTRRLQEIVAAIYNQSAAEGFNLWSVELLGKLPDDIRVSGIGQDLAVAAGTRLGGEHLVADLLPQDLSGRQWLIPTNLRTVRTTSLWVGRETEGLVLAGQETLLQNGQRLEDVPATTPLVVWLSWDGSQRREKVSILPGQKAGPIPTGEHVVTIETFTGTRWTLTPTTAQTPIEEVPQLASTIQVSLTNQDVIDAFAEVIQASNLTGWALMEQNGIAVSALSADRAGVYQGPDLASLPALTEEQRAMLLARLRAAVSVAGNALETLPDEVFAYANLRRLDLSGNQLAELPARIGNFAGLEELVLDDNRLTALPPEIGRLAALERLSAAGNALGELPGSLSTLQHLEALDLRNNRLQRLPSWLDQLTGLKSLDLRGNPLSVAGSVLEQVDRPQAILAALAPPALGLDAADLEVFLFVRDANSYGMTLRFRHPAAGLDTSYSAWWVLDWAALRQHKYDSASYGEQLASQLLAAQEARAFFDQAMAVATGQHTPINLRLRISPEAERLHALRWETLRLPGSDAPLATGGWVRFSRYLESATWRPVSLPLQGPPRALIAIANPKDIDRWKLTVIDVAAESARARAAWGDGPVAELTAPGQVTLDNLMAHLGEGYEILYLVAHSTTIDGKPELLLEREDSTGVWVDGAEIATRLAEMQQPTRLVILVGSDTADLALRLVDAGVLAVVTMEDKVAIATFADFMPTFLRELGFDGQVDRAMTVARGAFLERQDWWAPALFTRLRDGRLFASVAQTPFESRHFSDEIVYVNGINALTGAPLVEQMDFATLAAIIKGQPVDRTKARDLTVIAQMHTTPTLRLPDGISPTDVSKAGWAVVLHTDEDPLVRQQLERLVEHRRGQIQDDTRVKILEYADEPDWKSWLAKHKVGVGNVFPQRVPYYLLLVGGPERIPFEFGQLLSLEYAVGLLHFDSVDGYRHYVDSLIAYETGAAPPRRKEAVFFRTQEKYDHATRLSALNLVQPLADGSPGLEDDMDKPVAATRGFATRRVWDAAATRPALAEIFAPPAGRDPAAFLFTASHGLGFRQPHPDQPAIQGALKCQDNAGFSAKTLDETPDVRVHGLVAFFFACYGAGTPREEQYLRAVDQPPPLLADKPFIAALPKALLSHPQGGALACIGHIERAWNYSFSTSNTGEQLIPYWNAVRRILAGLPVGYALKDMRERYATLSAGLSQTLENMKFGFQPSDKELVTAWSGRNDAGGYVVIGDPATRLRLDTLVA